MDAGGVLAAEMLHLSEFAEKNGMESSADYQKPCQRNFLSGKLLTPRG